MKTKIMTILLILSLAFNLGIIATFGYHRLLKREFKRRPEESRGHGDRMQKMLNLTDEQVKIMEKDRAELQKMIVPVRDELQKKRAELFTLLNASTVDNTKVDKLVNDISLLQIKIEKNVIGNFISMKKNLTPEQQKKLKTVMPKGFMGMPPDEPDRDRHSGRRDR